MPRADAAVRIQRTPALKYIGASLAGEREPAETEHCCSHPGTVPLSLEKGGGKASPDCSLSPAWGPEPCSRLEGAHTHPQGLGEAPALPRIPVSGPSPVPMPTLCPGESLARLSHAGTPKQSEGVLSFPKAHYVSKSKPAGVTPYSRLAEAFTFLRTMLCIP